MFLTKEGTLLVPILVLGPKFLQSFFPDLFSTVFFFDACQAGTPNRIRPCGAGFKALTISCRCLPKPLLARAPLPTVNLTPILVFLDSFGIRILFPSATKVALMNSRDRKEHSTAPLLTSRYGASAEIDATMSSSPSTVTKQPSMINFTFWWRDDGTAPAEWI